MSLDNIITDIVSRLRQGMFPNEQSISLGIVLRVLQQLGWEPWDNTVLWPEYQTGEGRADFALCHPARHPAVFIEVKQPGRAEEGVRQALEYAFHTGVPFVVLTDGKTWSFYLPAEKGSYEERRVFKLDLFEREPSEAATILTRYLLRNKVETGEALETARTEYRTQNRSAQARAAIPEAWRELIEKGDELLVELLTDAVESKAGIRPAEDDVTEFLLSLLKPVILQQPSASPQRTAPRAPTQSVAPPRQPQTDARVSSSSRSGTLILNGNAFHYANAIGALIIVLRELATVDPTFLQRCSQHPEIQGTNRKYIGRDPVEMYPTQTELREMVEPLPGGWLVMTNLNNLTKRKIIRVAAEVAGLRFGHDVRVDF